MFRGEVNWARIISLFAVAAGLASDCVKQGEYACVNVCEVVGEEGGASVGGWFEEGGVGVCMSEWVDKYVCVCVWVGCECE